MNIVQNVCLFFFKQGSRVGRVRLIRNCSLLLVQELLAEHLANFRFWTRATAGFNAVRCRVRRRSVFLHRRAWCMRGLRCLLLDALRAGGGGGFSGWCANYRESCRDWRVAYMWLSKKDGRRLLELTVWRLHVNGWVYVGSSVLLHCRELTRGR